MTPKALTKKYKLWVWTLASPWLAVITLLSFSSNFLTCQVEIIIIFTLQGLWWIKLKTFWSPNDKEIKREHRSTCLRWGKESLRTGVSNLRDLMPDDLRSSWCNSNRNRVHRNVTLLSLPEASPHPLVHDCLPQNWSLVPKRWGTTAL